MSDDMPVLSMTSDQGSSLFASQIHLLYSTRIRGVWFPDINHQESRVETDLLPVAGMGQLSEKNDFISKLHYGPKKKRGHWHGQVMLAAEATSKRILAFLVFVLDL